MLNGNSNHIDGKRGSVSQMNNKAPVEGSFEWRLAGPMTHVVLRENSAEMVKIPIPRRVILNWSQAGRDQLAARSREKPEFGSKTLVLPNWANEEGVRWLLDWMMEKCNARDTDDCLRVEQQVGNGSTRNANVRLANGTDLALVMKLQQAAAALQLPKAVNRLSDWMFDFAEHNALDAYQMRLLWELFGNGPPRWMLHRVLDHQADHMMNGSLGDFDAIEAYLEKHPELDALVQMKLEARYKGMDAVMG